MSPPAATYMCVSSQFFGYTDDSPDFDFGLVCELRFWTTDSQRICTPDDAILVTVILETVCKGNPIFFRQSLLPIDTVRRISWHRIDKKSGTEKLVQGALVNPHHARDCGAFTGPNGFESPRILALSAQLTAS